MADNSANESIRRYLQDAIAAESSFENQLWSFSREGDDFDVQSAFAIHAKQTAAQCQRLTVRLEQLGESPSKAKELLAHVFGVSPAAAQSTHTPEERLAQNLVTVYAIEAGECAMYEALASVARTCGDAVTEELAREIQAEERRTAETVWGFIPSRSKIAFNTLTAGEMDPSVDTKMADDRIL